MENTEIPILKYASLFRSNHLTIHNPDNNFQKILAINLARRFNNLARYDTTLVAKYSSYTFTKRTHSIAILKKQNTRSIRISYSFGCINKALRHI